MRFLQQVQIIISYSIITENGEIWSLLLILVGWFWSIETALEKQQQTPPEEDEEEERTQEFDAEVADMIDSMDNSNSNNNKGNRYRPFNMSPTTSDDEDEDEEDKKDYDYDTEEMEEEEKKSLIEQANKMLQRR